MTITIPVYRSYSSHPFPFFLPFFLLPLSPSPHSSIPFSSLFPSRDDGWWQKPATILRRTSEKRADAREGWSNDSQNAGCRGHIVVWSEWRQSLYGTAEEFREIWLSGYAFSKVSAGAWIRAPFHRRDIRVRVFGHGARGGRGEEERSDMVGRGRLKYLRARARIEDSDSRGFFLSSFFFFFFPLVRVARVVWLYRVSCCIWWIEVYICYVKMIKKEEEEGKRKRAQVFDFAFEFINESLVRQAALHYPRRGLFKMIFVDRFIFGPYFWIKYCIFYWKLCLIF